MNRLAIRPAHWPRAVLGLALGASVAACGTDPGDAGAGASLAAADPAASASASSLAVDAAPQDNRDDVDPRYAEPAPEPELDDNGNPIPAGPGQPSRAEIEQALAKQQARENR